MGRSPPAGSGFLRFRRTQIPFDEIDWHQLLGLPDRQPITIVLPIIIVEEIDNLKKNGDPAKKARVRETLAKFEALFQTPGHPVALGAEKQVLIELLGQERMHAREEINDFEIVSIAEQLQPFSIPKVTVATFDTNMALMVRTAGLNDLRISNTERSDSQK